MLAWIGGGDNVCDGHQAVQGRGFQPDEDRVLGHGLVQARSFSRVDSLLAADALAHRLRTDLVGPVHELESFFSLLQKNVLDRRKWATCEELRIAILTWIERTYHRRRRQAALGRPTPVELETVMTTPALQAA